MRRLSRALWLSFSVLALAACKKEPVTAEADVLSASIPEEAPRAPLALTEAKLSSYLGYQRRMLDVYASRLDAGRKADLERVVEAEEQARRQSGLDRRELAEIEEMVRAVIGKRVYGAAVPGDDSLNRMRALQPKLSEQGREEVARSIAEVEKSQEELVRLTEERRRFGESNVDLLLAREAELTRLWKETLGSFAPREAKAQKHP